MIVQAEGNMIVQAEGNMIVQAEGKQGSSAFVGLHRNRVTVEQSKQNVPQAREVPGNSQVVHIDFAGFRFCLFLLRFDVSTQLVSFAVKIPLQIS